jgi:hypothetical protein
MVPFATIFAVRAVIDAPNSYGPSFFLAHLGQAAHLDFWPMLLQAAFSGLGVIPVLLLVQYQSWIAFIRRRWEWVVYAAIAVAFVLGGGDKGRLFLYILPLVVILAVHNSMAFGRYCSPRRITWWAVVTLALHWYIGGYFGSMGSFSDYLARMVPEHSDGHYMPFLLRNLGLGAVLLALTVQFIFREWYFCIGIGFTRRDAVSGAGSAT